MAIAFLDFQDIAQQDWDGLVIHSPDGWTFSLHAWQRLILEVKEWGLQDRSFGIEENGQLVAVMPLQFNPNASLIASSGWGGSGPVLAAALRAQDRGRLFGLALEHGTEIGRSLGAQRFEISRSPVTRTSLENRRGVNDLVFYGFEDRSELSQVIDLRQDEEALWQQLSADARRQIRKAKERGLAVSKTDWAQQLDHYYELHRRTYARTGSSAHPKAYFAGMAHGTAPSGHSVLWQVHDGAEGEPIAYHNAAWFADGAYYHTGCSTEAAAELGAGYLLFWGALLGAKAAGIKWYDCGAIFPNAADAKQRGLSGFKTKFGGETHRWLRAECAIAGAQPHEVVHEGMVARARKSVRALFGGN